MTPPLFYDWDGELLPHDGRPDAPYLYQWVHVLEGQPLHLAAHLSLLAEGYSRLAGRDFRCNPAEVTHRIMAFMHANRYPATGSSFVRLRLYLCGRLALLPGEVSLYTGYALRSLRPVATVLKSNMPLGALPTSIREAAAQLNRQLAVAAGAQVAIRCDADGKLCDADDAPLFAVRGLDLLTPPLPANVEGAIVREAIASAGLTLREESLTTESLRTCDELFYFDHRGITSLRSCDGTPYMDLIAGRIAQALAAPF